MAGAAHRPETHGDPLRRSQPLEELLNQAAAVRRPGIARAAVVTLDNHCVNDCVYCPYARSNRATRRFTLATERVLADVEALAAAGCEWLFLQTGQTPSRRAMRWVETIAQLHASHPALRIVFGAGEQTQGLMEALRDAGAWAYWIGLECADPALFQELRPVGLHARRRFTLRAAMLAGLKTATGLTVGLPGESEDQLAASAAEVVELAPDVVCVHVFHPCPGSAAAQAQPAEEALTLRTIAALRLALPEATLLAGCPVPAPGALDPDRALAAGADGVLVNVDEAVVFPRFSVACAAAVDARAAG